MGGQYFSNAGVFLIETLIGLYCAAFMLRFMLQVARADFYNPVSQFLVKVTNPLLSPARRLIPGIGGIDWASIVVMVGIKVAQLVLIGLLPRYAIPAVPGMLILVAAELLSLLINIYIFAIIIQAVVSWINPGSYNPVMGLLHQLTAPILNPARRMLPPISGLDLSPMLAIIVLYLVMLLFIHPLTDLGRQLSMH